MNLIEIFSFYINWLVLFFESFYLSFYINLKRFVEFFKVPFSDSYEDRSHSSTFKFVTEINKRKRHIRELILSAFWILKKASYRSGRWKVRKLETKHHQHGEVKWIIAHHPSHVDNISGNDMFPAIDRDVIIGIWLTALDGVFHIFFIHLKCDHCIIAL